VTSRLSLDVPSGPTSMRGKVIVPFGASTAILLPASRPKTGAGAPSPHRSSVAVRVSRWDATTPPMGFGPLRRLNLGIIAPVCLPDAIRSQSFSLSQRFEPAQASWFCFTPHPPLGFRSGLQSLSRSVSRDASRRPFPSYRSRWRALARLPATSGRFSDRASVPGWARLNPQPSRCSLDLFPLRGVPIQPLGQSPPLMCLLPRRWPRPKTRLRATSRHFRVSSD
jgi:hypothetical protein